MIWKNAIFWNSNEGTHIPTHTPASIWKKDIGFGGFFFKDSYKKNLWSTTTLSKIILKCS